MFSVPSTVTHPVAARVPTEHARRIAALADRDKTTISQVVARLVAERLDPTDADRTSRTPA